MAVHSKPIQNCIDKLCSRGCSAVRDIIADLEAGRTLPETASLSQEECAVVLEELKVIMKVYDERS
ncbi:MAG: hypothetical protein OEY67_05975 [Gammaproteobacteria bacterium]|nr:hypothetical protein [Gammaproteobacteria bacterium]